MPDQGNIADRNDQTESLSTSSSLVERLQAQEPEAWRQWADLYGPLIYFWSRRYSLQPEDAADVFQEVFGAVSAGIGRFQHDRARGRFRGWLWTITRNKIQDHFRSQNGREAAVGGTEALRRIAEIPEQLAEDPTDPDGRGELIALFHRAVQAARAEFEDRTWAAFWRTLADRQPTREVADELGMTVNAVRLARSRVLRRIRALLGDVNE